MNYRVQIRPLDCDQELGAGEWSAGVSELKEGPYDESCAF